MSTNTSKGKLCRSCQEKQNHRWQLLPDLDSLNKHLITVCNQDSPIFAPKTFIQRQNPQDSNLIFRLPIELRQVVYKHLLTSVEPLRTRYEPVPKHPMNMWAGFIRTGYNTTFQHGLTPAILGACQKIYFEALPYLIEHNIPSIILTMDSFQACYDPLEDRRMKVFAANQCYSNYDFEFDKLRPIDLFIYRTFRNCKVIEIQVQFEVEMEEPDWHELEKWARILRKLRPLVKEKTISIDLQIFGAAPRQTADVKQSQLNLLQELGRWYEAFKLLRCKKVVFPPGRELEFAKIAAVMESQEPIIDLQWSYSKLRHVVTELEGPGWDNEEVYEYTFSAQSAAEKGNVGEFRRLRELMFSATRKSLENMFETTMTDDDGPQEIPPSATASNSPN